MRITDYYTACSRYGGNASFVANVIALHHAKPKHKLKGLLKLLEAGHSINTAQFSIDRLTVDGELFPWDKLETI